MGITQVSKSKYNLMEPTKQQHIHRQVIPHAKGFNCVVFVGPTFVHHNYMYWENIT